ncbi:MAG: ABC transporter ATP-binding protein [Planctomycetota bacterium]|nr:MAG: ABC transporter ATP-binding protein [Planctomycetota bacterium]
MERNRAKASTASNVQSRIKQLARIERIELPPEPPDIKLRFPEPPSAGALAFRLCGVAKRYGEREVFSDVELELPAGEKLAVVGVNGAGKTTLLRLVAGELEPSAGTVELGHNVLLQTFSQYEDDLPSGDRTLLQAMEEAAPPDCAVSRRTVLGCFLFGGDDVHKRIAVLSGGERARLKLARMLLRPSNLLVLDEPTNHLDLHSKDVLLAALEAFRGTVVFVSHDRWFLSRLATSVLELRDGRARLFPCDYDQYRWRVERDAREETARSPVSRESRAEAPRRRSDRPHRAGRERRREERRLQREAEEQQARLEEQEVRLAALEERMSAPGFFAGGKPESREVVLEFEELRKQVEAGYERLEELLGALEALGDAEAGGAPP